MRRLIAGFAASVDGYIEAPDRSYDWIIIDESIDFAAYAKQFDTYFYGRKSYEAVMAMGNKPAHGSKHYIFSNTLPSVNKHYTLISGDIKEQVLHIKRQEGKDIALFGGASLLASLLNLQLVDEIVISFIPVLLGTGKPMVDVLSEKVWLHLLQSKTYANGTLQVSYRVKYQNG